METLINEKELYADGKREMIRIGISTDFAWFELKLKLIVALKAVGYELADIGDYELVAGENYPDFVVPVAKVESKNAETQNQNNHKNGLVACEAANKIPGVCAVLFSESFTPSKEIEKEDLFIRCIGSPIKGYSLSKKKVMTFLNADRDTIVQSNQCLAKVRVLGRPKKMAEREKYFV